MLNKEDYLSIVFQRGDDVLVHVSYPEKFRDRELRGIINIKNIRTGDNVDFNYIIKDNGKDFEIKDYNVDIKTTEGSLFNVLEDLAKESINKFEDVSTILKPIKSKKAQLREGDNEDLSNNENKEDIPNIPNKVKPINEQGENEVEENEEENDNEDVAKRINDLVKDVTRLKEVLKNYLFSSYKLTVSEDELRKLTSKILDLIASFVSDLTTERIHEFAEDELKVDDDKK
ncbi:MAG TPA: hypothetical protein P5513_05440 [Candidatus Diapherotrites archaeon]|nr:hypothetical protein [Candidatus Diapherotrites archaeon]